MKQQKNLLPLLACTLLLLPSCSGEKQSQSFTLSGSGLSSDLNGKYLYVFANSREPMDSVLVNDGAFTLTIDSVKSTQVYSLTDRQSGGVSFVTEIGKAELKSPDGSLQEAEILSVEPKDGANTKLTEYSKRKAAIEQPILNRHNAWYEKFKVIKKDNPNSDGTPELLKEKAEIDSVYSTNMRSFYTSEYDANKDNIVGAVAFGQLPFEDKADFINRYEAATEVVKNYGYNHTLYNLYKKSQDASAGAKYKDIEMTDDKGTKKKISDLWKPETYLLIDFWASWCGPCRAAMPHLSTLNKSIGDKLTILSIGGMQETATQNEKARQELGMDWTTFFDSGAISADEYGVSSIPTLILIAPDGTILARSNDPAVIDAKLKEVGLL